MMKDNFSEYIFLDGMWLQERQLLKLAMNVGSFALAEHYLCALLANAVIYGKRDVIDMVNEVREFYGVPKIPVGNQESTFARSRAESLDDKARMLFKKMPIDKRREILKESLRRLRTQFHLFIYSKHWQGVFSVIKDRLECDALKQNAFIAYASDITPEDWPDSLKIRLNTIKNFARDTDSSEKGEAYYDRDYNPQQEICDTFWNILKEAIFAAI